MLEILKTENTLNVSMDTALIKVDAQFEPKEVCIFDPSDLNLTITNLLSHTFNNIQIELCFSEKMFDAVLEPLYTLSPNEPLHLSHQIIVRSGLLSLVFLKSINLRYTYLDMYTLTINLPIAAKLHINPIPPKIHTEIIHSPPALIAESYLITLKLKP